MACDFGDIICGIGEGAGEIISNASNDAVQQLVNQVLEGFGAAVASVGTMWVSVPTPVLTAGEGTTRPVGAPPAAGAFTEILNYVSYVGLVVCVLSIIALGALLALRNRRGEGFGHVGRLGIVFIAVMLVSGGSALVAGLLPDAAPDGSSTTVGYLQNSLWFYVGALAVLSVIVGGIRMAWEQRAQPGKDLLQSLITLVVVSGAGLTVIGLAVVAADAFSVWVLNGATDCDVSVAGESNCFGTNVAGMMALSATSPIGTIGVLILGSLALLMTYVQVALMVVRGGLLVILAGVLPFTASFTNTQMGRQWFTKTIGWTLAFILYKPAAALIYAAAFSLTGTDAFQDDGGGIWSILTGMALMLMALVALPALLRFIAPMTGAVAGGGTAGLAMAGAAGAVGGELATGAIRRASTAASPAFGAGGGGGSWSPSAAPTGSSPAGAGGTARSAAPATTARSTAASVAGGAMAGASAAAGGGAVAGVRVAAGAVKGAGQAAQRAVRSVTDESTGNGPTGS